MILNLIEQRINMDKSDIIVGVCHGEFGSNLFQNVIWYDATLD